MSVLDHIESWATALCRVEDLRPASVAVALGLTAESDGVGNLTAVSPPPGIAEVVLLERAGALSSISISLRDDQVCVGDFNQRFGPAQPVAHAPDSPFSTVLYTAREPGASHKCSIFADLRYSGSPLSSVSRVTLRRDRVLWPDRLA